MSRLWTGFRSLFADGMQAFLAYKRALGCQYRAEESALRLLDRFLDEHAISAIADVTPTVIDDFLMSRPRPAPRSYNHLYGTLVRFFNWMVRHERLQCSPVRSKPRRGNRVRLPFLLDPAAARRLFDAAGQLPDNGFTACRASSFRTIFTLLYGLGLRVGEVARLRVRDVELTRRVLDIRDTKFAKSRLVPYGPGIHARLTAHLARRAEQQSLSAEMPVFAQRSGRPISADTISQTFHRLVPHLGLVIPDGVVGPRAHDLRHAFATRTLLRWYRQGIDPRSRLLSLATFLGHVDPASTAVYLTMTPELLNHASERFRTWAKPVLEEVPR